MGVPRGRETKKGTKSLFEEIMVKNFPYIRKKNGHPNSRISMDSNLGEPKLPKFKSSDLSCPRMLP